MTDFNRLIRYLAYTLELLVLFMLQETPGLLPTIFGSRPLLVLPAVLTIALFEKELPAMIEAVIIGIIRKNAGRMVLNIIFPRAREGLPPASSLGSWLNRPCRSGSSGDSSSAAIKMEGTTTVITRGTSSRGRNSRLLAATP